jgi:23S rRNA A2030 N6-methylase RlmJ
MSRFFIISFEILALIAMLRSPFIHYWFNDIHSGVANWMLEISLLAEKKELALFRQTIMSHTQDLSENQMAYLDNITANKMSMGQFNKLYCQSNDKNPYLYGANLHYVCSEIRRSGVLNS